MEDASKEDSNNNDMVMITINGNERMVPYITSVEYYDFVVDYRGKREPIEYFSKQVKASCTIFVFNLMYNIRKNANTTRLRINKNESD